MALDDFVGPHYLNLNFSDDFLNENAPTYSIQLPYPIHKPLKEVNSDIIDEFHQNVNLYSHKLSTLQKDFRYARNKVMNQTFTDSHATITRGLLDFCNTEKPGIQFPCDYNPYYTSGFLEYVNLDNVEYLMRPDCDNNIRLTKLTKPWKNRKINVEIPFEDNITGISTSNDSNNIFLLRHKSQINLLKVTDLDGEIKQTRKFKKFLLDSQICKTHFGVVRSDTKFRLYDIETNKKINVDDNIADSVIRCGFANETIILLDQKKLKLFDKRSNDFETFEPQFQACNFFCSAKVHRDALYVGSRHYLIRADLRFLKEFEFCTHLMKYGPCYMDLVEGLLCLSSQKVEEKVMFSGNPISSLPFKIPSITETFNECRLKRDILLVHGVKERVTKSVGGVKIIHEDNDYFLYSVNTLGDIFKQKITNNSDCDKTKPVESFHYWVNKLPERPKPLHLTSVENASLARFVLNKDIGQERMKKYGRATKKTSRFLNHFNTVYNKKNLSELAQNFLSVWDDEDEEERPEVVSEVPEVAPIDKVANWIESNYFF
ncbi:uncharacterized protein LOC123005907 [Tribolium madens]|uniref:uncharacterized protein LOC123005907 n=1 Tax=Tribolium madens TaxID=41895 RepID=UPI001CF76118|nr:uncharacterized protein LOC123005907 [Tribolium madens]